MTHKFLIYVFISLFFAGFNLSAQTEHEAETLHHTAQTETHQEQDKPFDPTDMINHHLSDSHDYEFALPFIHKTFHLPVILWTKNGLTVFSSGEFQGDEHGEVIVEKNGQKFKRIHDLIVYADQVGEHVDPKDVSLSQRPLDFSITKNVASMLLTFFALLLVLLYTKKSYNDKKVPKGLASFMEPLIVFIRDMAKENIGPKYEKFVPFLLTVFFFILFSNLFGLIPFSPFGYNLTGNILVTFVLAVIVFVITNINGNKDYWSHILWPPGVPVILKPFIALIEILSIFTKPFALMIRLFANILAGHTIILTFVTLIFVFKNWGVPFASGFATIFMYISELLVAFLQAYVFTLLSAIYFGMAVKEEAH